MFNSRCRCAALLVLLLLAALRATLVSADEIPEPDAATAAEIKALIEQLGDETYLVREAATERILDFGLPAMKLVEQGAKHPDREIRYRCQRLQITLRDVDLQRRLEAFAADVKGEKDHGLPAWDRFAELYGSTAEARQLFVEIFRAEPDILKTLQTDADQASEVVTARMYLLQQMRQLQQRIELGSVAGMLFAAAQEELKLSDQTQQMILQLCYDTSFREAISDSPKKELLTSLLSKLVVRSEGWVAASAIQLAMRYDIQEGLTPARKLVSSKGAGQPHLLYTSLLAVAKMGDTSDVKQIEPLLDDKTVLMNYQIDKQRIECQVRDFALLAVFHLVAKDKEKVKGTLLEKGDLKEVGFDRLTPNEMQLYSPNSIGFTSQDKRDEAFEKWERLKAQMKK